MLLYVVESLFLEKMDTCFIVGVGIDYHHSYSLIDHPGLDFSKQFFPAPHFCRPGRVPIQTR